MRAGRLKEIIWFDQPVSQLGTWNEDHLEFTPFFETRGGIEPIRGTEPFLTNQVNAEMTTKIVTRWSPNLNQVDSKWRIRHFDATANAFVIYNIGAPPIHTSLGQREMIFLCKSGLNDG